MFKCTLQLGLFALQLVLTTFSAPSVGASFQVVVRTSLVKILAEKTADNIRALKGILVGKDRFVHNTCICYAQSSDSDHPRISLRKAWIAALRNNPRIAHTNLGSVCKSALLQYIGL